MESVEELCDNIALINKSHVVITGGVDEIRHKYGNNNVEVIYTGKAALDSVSGIYRLLSDKDDSGRHTAVLALEEGTNTNDVLKAILSQDVTVSASARVRPFFSALAIRSGYTFENSILYIRSLPIFIPPTVS